MTWATFSACLFPSMTSTLENVLHDSMPRSIIDMNAGTKSDGPMKQGIAPSLETHVTVESARHDGGDSRIPRSSKRIALLFEYPTYLGGERSMLACVDWMQRQAAPFEFIAIAPEQGRLARALASHGVRITPFRSAASGLSREQVEDELVCTVQSADADLLHANSLAMGRLTGRIGDRLSIPTTAHLRDIVNLSHAAIADLNRNRFLVAVSHATRAHHVTQGLHPDKVAVIHNGVDLAKFRPQPATGWLHRELGLPATTRLIATIGQIGLRKGQEILAAAAETIARGVPDIHFLLIGERTSQKAESIEYERSILRRFEVPDLQGRLHRMGYRDDIASVMAEVDLVVHPANQEPLGRVLLEAAACGVPVVATNVGGTAEIVQDGITGRLIAPRDVLSLAHATTDLLSDRSQLESMKLATRERAVREFDVARTAAEMSRFWQSAMLR